MMNDLISRQAAINSFRYDDDGTAWDVDDIVYRLEQFPSAQPMMTNAADLINRGDAILAVYKRIKQLGMENDADVLSIRQSIRDLASAQPEQRWIPVTERSPEDLEEVNVTWINHIPEPYYDFLKDKSFTGSAVYYRGDWYWYSSRCTDILAEYGTNGMDKVDDGIEITAWMPLPEPWKEGETE